MEVETVLNDFAKRAAQYLVDKNIDHPLFVGIRSGGVWIAEWLVEELNIDDALSIIDISFYRDDFTRKGLNPQILGSELPDSIQDRDIILVDDVIMSGRTIRAAMNELFDYGRPNRIHLMCLVDIGQRELPIEPNVIGMTKVLADNERVQVTGPKPLGIEITLVDNTSAD